jgi:PAS domain S-box-containing protein
VGTVAAPCAPRVRRVVTARRQAPARAKAETVRRTRATVPAHPTEDGLAVDFLDVSAKRAAEVALAASEHRYRMLFERAGDAIVIVDDSGRYVDANTAAGTLLGRPSDEIIGKRLADFVVDTLEGVDMGDIWAALRHVGDMRGEVQLRRPDGEVRDAEFHAVADISPGLHLSVMRDVTDRHRHERAADQRIRILDALRRLSPGDDPEATADAICTEIVDRGDFPSAAIFSFGTENEATALGARLRDGGGVEVLPRLSEGRLGVLRTKAHDGPWIDPVGPATEGSPQAAYRRLGIQSVAFAPIESDGHLVGLLAAGADELPAALIQRMPALVEFAALASSLLGPGLRRRAERATKRARVREVIATAAFHPVFQPIVDMRSGAILGFEALTRFDDGIPPDRTFLAAADVGVGLELEAATIGAALDAAGPLPAYDFLDINVSPDLVMARTQLRTLLKRSDSRVILEITEHVDVPDYVALRRAIKVLGPDVRFAVDDAGAGFASLRHILELAPSHVKLDRALVSRIDADPARQALVAGLVHFAGAIDVMLIAEGVETVAERDALLRLGVDVGQGFLFGRPATADKVAVRRGGPAPHPDGGER